MKRFEQLAVATAYADAKGLPYETKTKEQIEELGGVANVLIKPDSYSPDFPDFQGKPVGTFSDDTQHTLAMMESLVNVGTFNLKNLAQRLKKEMQQSDAGWGGATKVAIEQIQDDMSVAELSRLGVSGSNGCGPLMRLAPLAIYEAECTGSSPFANQSPTEFSTTLTHNSTQSSIASLVHTAVLREIVEMQGDAKSSRVGYYAALRYEDWFDEEAILSKRLAQSMRAKNFADEIYEDRKEAFSVWSVQALSYAVFDAMRDAPFTELIDAVIAEGGDTDSTAAVVAGMWVCANPEKHPEVDARELQQAERLVATGKAFASFIANQKI